MDRAGLERWLEEGKSLIQIGRLTNRDPSTVGYWVKKHGLEARGSAKYASRGGITREELETQIERGAGLQQMAANLDRSVSTVRYWMKRYGLTATGGTRRRKTIDGPRTAVFVCRHHGETEFILENRGYYRCKRCRAAAVARRRRVVKQALVTEAGGACAVCGYDRSPAALQFHHLDPSTKEFHIGYRGYTRSLARARREAGKCVLLCANCHAEVEAGFATLPDAHVEGSGH